MKKRLITLAFIIPFYTHAQEKTWLVTGFGGISSSFKEGKTFARYGASFAFLMPGGEVGISVSSLTLAQNKTVTVSVNNKLVTLEKPYYLVRHAVPITLFGNLVNKYRNSGIHAGVNAGILPASKGGFDDVVQVIEDSYKTKTGYACGLQVGYRYIIPQYFEFGIEGSLNYISAKIDDRNNINNDSRRVSASYYSLLLRVGYNF